MLNFCTIYKSIEAASGTPSDAALTSITAFSALFSSIQGIANRVIIRTDSEILIRLNKVTNAQITISANEKFETDWIGISEIFITATNANLKIIVAR